MNDAKPTLRPGPREVRTMILEDHKELRTRLARLSECLEVERLEAHGDELTNARQHFDKVSRFFAAHIAFEDEFLVPLLRDDFAWGEIRARAILEHHAEQREELADLARLVRSESVDPEGLRANLDTFVSSLAIDMQEEEAGVLRPDILGDDIVTVEAGA